MRKYPVGSQCCLLCLKGQLYPYLWHRGAESTHGVLGSGKGSAGAANPVRNMWGQTVSQNSFGIHVVVCSAGQYLAMRKKNRELVVKLIFIIGKVQHLES